MELKRRNVMKGENVYNVSEVCQFCQKNSYAFYFDVARLFLTFFCGEYSVHRNPENRGWYKMQLFYVAILKL